MDKLGVCVLFRASKKTGKIDKTVTGLGCGLLKLYAMNNTTATKETFVFERESGKCLFWVFGKKNDLPDIKDCSEMTCMDFGIDLKDLQDIKDDRFDREEK